MHPDSGKFRVTACPDCGAPLPGTPSACPRCALPLAGPTAAELWRVDSALADLRMREAELHRRRGHLLGLLREERTRARRASTAVPGVPGVVGVPGVPGAAAVSGMAGAPGVPGGAGGRAGSAEVSRRTAQNLLLILGGLLLTVAAVVFTVVSWGYLGIAGRGAILVVVTGVALAVPALLLKRGLTATAETVGVLALALMALDGYAAHRVGLLAGLSWADYGAGVIAVVAAGAAVYGRVLPLRVAPIIAILLAQVPMIMWFGSTATGTAAAFTAATLLDAAVWSRAKRTEIRVTAAICLGVSALAAVFVAAVESVVGDLVWAPAGLLVVLAAAGVYVGMRVVPLMRWLPLGLAGLALMFALGSPVRQLLNSSWQLLPYPLAAMAVMAAALWLPVVIRRAGVVSGAVMVVLGGLPLVLVVLNALLMPFRNVSAVWAGTRWEVAQLALARPGVVFLAVAAAVCVVAARRWSVLAPRVAASDLSGLVFGCGLVLALSALLVVPAAFGLGYAASAGVPLLVAVALSVAATRYPAAAWGAGTAAVLALTEGLAAEAATYTVLGVLLVTWAVLYRRPAALAGAALSGSGLVWAVLYGLEVAVLDAAALGFASGAVLALIGWYGTPKPATDTRQAGPKEGAEAQPVEDVWQGTGAPPVEGVWQGTGAPPVEGVWQGTGAPPVAGARGAGGVRTAWEFGRVLAVVLAGAAVLPVVDVVVRGVANFAGLLDPWSGVPSPPEGRPAALLALVVAGVVLVVATRPAVAVVVAGVLVAVVPVTVRLPYQVSLGLLLLATAVAAALAARRVTAGGQWARAGDLAIGVAVWLGVLAVAGAAVTQTGTIVTLAVLAGVAAGASLWGRGGTAGVTLAGVLAVAEVGAVAAAHGLRTASLVCAGAGVVAVAAAAWKRVPAIGYLGTGFLLVSSWMRLWAEEVTVVEAYTLPFSLVLLAIGWLRGRQGSSWKAYGAGLVFTFGPSLLAEPTALRSLLLGAAALAVTVAGARYRLQAPAVLGALTLGAVAVRELAPWVAGLVTALPRWVPIAVGGMLLLVVGATYEARKRDLVRLKDAVVKLR
ncbi:SCO7613 C-terminal domain-containing membrane protein [Nonomuraea sp. NPDC050394]|uniref:SCO7613 C-terminal domain-containing membrane protein n=1 Tax=Nonomuraea sp. NPDC050394 TaxID=3364363 RepID=UPI0037B6C85B